jgi:tyrosine-specific transport protein
MNSKLLGGILLVVGTTIGAGILALPVATAQMGFWGSMALLIGAWGLMTVCAFVFLEVNLWLPPNTNLISMAGATLGKYGQGVTWCVYLFLLYSILCAYVAGGGDLFHYFLTSLGIEFSQASSSILFTALFSIVVFFGIKSVDFVNRGLMFGKMGAFFLLVLFIVPYVSSHTLIGDAVKHTIPPASITVTAVAFGSLMIIPSLRSYFGEDIKSLRKAIFIGMFIPLLCYIAWDMVILGVIPLEGKGGLREMMHSASSNSDLLASLSSILKKDSINSLAKFFTSISMTTSFLSISLCLTDFLADGFRLEKKGKGNAIVFVTTFLPPLAIVLYNRDAFLPALQYAGVSCIVLMVLLPALMAWRGRYSASGRNALALEGDVYQVFGGKVLLAVLIAFATLMVIFSLGGVV